MYRKYIKRALDVILACAILAVTFPLVVIIAILIKRETPGPVLFTQERTGLHGRKFQLYKFRSMTYGNNVRDLSRQDEVTRIGATMRRLSIDELPQLLNVLRGDMSFIGPRPWITEYFEHMNNTQRERVKVLPGITGLAQAYGRNSITIHKKIQYDLEYVKRISLKEDIRIIFITLNTMFDKSTNDMGKEAIQNELDTLKNQRLNGLTEKLRDEQYL